jgi:DNA modification methylase
MVPTAVLYNGDTLELLDPKNLGLAIPDGHQVNAEGVGSGGLVIGEVPASMKYLGRLRADAGVTDPPYGFDFAGEDDWDSFTDERAFSTAADDSETFAKFTEDWSRGLKQNVLKFGSHLLAFTASRTIGPVDRGLQRAGYAIPRVLAWLYASGQVKNTTDLRPGFEPIFCGRIITDSNGKIVTGKGLTDLYKKHGLGQLHAQVWKEEDGRHPTDVCIEEELVNLDPEVQAQIAKSPGTFFVSKASPKDRDRYCGDLPLVQKDSKISHMSTTNKEKQSTKHREDGTREPVMAQNYHPTVKSIELMRRLIRLVSRPGHVIIDPFMGSGTTGVAAMLEGRHFIGIERKPDFFNICQTRIRNARAEVEAQQ